MADLRQKLQDYINTLKKEEEEMAQRELQDYINTLKNEGIMDGEYEETMRKLNDLDWPKAKIDVINSFLSDGDECMRQLTEILSKIKKVDFTKVITAADQIKEGSTSLGGCRVAAAAQALRNAAAEALRNEELAAAQGLRNAGHDEDKKSCVTAYERVVDKYHLFRDKLRRLCELEKKIANPKPRRG